MKSARRCTAILAVGLLSAPCLAEQTNLPLRLGLNLHDGTRVIGVPGIKAMPFRTSYAKLEIPLADIVRVEIADDRERASMELRNGDGLSGVLALEKFDLETIFASISVGVEHVKSIDIYPAMTMAAIIRRGLVLYYPFDGEGDKVEDKSGKGNHGVKHAVTYARDGKHGGACKFNGSSSFLDLSGTAVKDLPAWENYTISVWFLNDGKGDHGRGYGQKIIDKTVMYHDFYLCVRPDTGALGLNTYEGSAGGVGDRTHDFRDGKWHHAVVLKKGAHGELWVDGRMKDSQENLKRVRNQAPLLVGYSKSSDHFQRKFWSGMMDELMIYDRALSKGEIRQIAVCRPVLGASGAGSIRKDAEVDDVRALKEREAKLMAEIAELRRLLKPEHPKLAKMLLDLDELRRRIGESTEPR